MNNSLLQTALALHREGNLPDAMRLYREALRDNPTNFDALYMLGFSHFQQSDFPKSNYFLGEALKIKPQSLDALFNRGNTLLMLGRPGDAIQSFELALAINPNFIEALEACGRTLQQMNRHEESFSYYDKALALRPNDTSLHYNRGNELLFLKRYEEAIQNSEALLAINPDYPYARGVLIDSKLQICDWRGITGERIKVADALRDGKQVISPFNIKALSGNPKEQLQAARLWVENECPPSATPLWCGQHYRHERIRIAYVSGDFSNSAVATLMAGVFEHHDHSQFETIAISFGVSDKSAMRKRLETAFDRFVDVQNASDVEIAQLLRKMEIDIAIDLMGFTGSCRTRIFAQRPAPVQVNYLGFPGTMGAPYIDYIVADKTVIPELQQKFYTEKIAYLPDVFLPRDMGLAPSSNKPSRAEAGLPETGFVFCSFNNVYKFSPEIFDTWMRLLRSVPESLLWLPQSNPSAMQRLIREATMRGITVEQLVFAPPVPATEDHLARLSLADLFLDTIPYNAHTTASDALWSGLPLLSCEGQCFAGRVAGSLLRALDLPELVTHSLDEYEMRALSLAHCPVALGRIRTKLARNRETRPLFDTVRYTRNLEQAFKTMWEQQKKGGPPSTFDIKVATQ